MLLSVHKTVWSTHVNYLLQQHYQFSAREEEILVYIKIQPVTNVETGLGHRPTASFVCTMDKKPAKKEKWDKEALILEL